MERFVKRYIFIISFEAKLIEKMVGKISDTEYNEIVKAVSGMIEKNSLSSTILIVRNLIFNQKPKGHNKRPLGKGFLLLTVNKKRLVQYREEKSWQPKLR